MSEKLVKPECILSVSLVVFDVELHKNKADRIIPFALTVALILPNEYLPLKYAYKISPQSSKFVETNSAAVEYAVDL